MPLRSETPVVERAEVPNTMPVEVEFGSAQSAPSLEEIGVVLENDFQSQVGKYDLFSVQEIIGQRFANVGLDGAKIDSLECRSTVCKMVASFDNVEADKVFFETMFLRRVTNTDADLLLASMALQVADRQEISGGKGRVVVYLTRPTERSVEGG